MTPEVFSIYDAEADEYVLVVRNFGRTEPFGPRLFRAPPHPEVKDRHATAKEAEADVAKVRAYFAGLGTRKISKKAARAEGA